MSWVQIQQLVKLTPKGGIPGQLPDAGRIHGNEYRCRFPTEVTGLIERVLQQRSRIQGKPVSFADAVKQLFSEALINKPFDEAEEKLREEAQREFLAEQLAVSPLVNQARELAEELGLLEVEELYEQSNQGPSISEESQPAASSRAGREAKELSKPEALASHVTQPAASSRAGQEAKELSKPEALASHVAQSAASSHARQEVEELSKPEAVASHVAQSAVSPRAGQDANELGNAESVASPNIQPACSSPGTKNLKTNGAHL